MKNHLRELEHDTKKASRALSCSQLSHQAFETIYNAWWDTQYDWRVHLDLIMSPLISADQFLQVTRRHIQHAAMQEEVMAQIDRFGFEHEVKSELLRPLLPNMNDLDRDSARNWSVTEQIAYRKLTGRFWPA